MNLKLIIDRLFYNSTGQAFISALFGFSIALLFKRVCKENCVLYYAPKQNEVEGKTFKMEDTCYKYTPSVVKCNEALTPPVLYYDGHRKPDNLIQEPGMFDKLFA